MIVAKTRSVHAFIRWMATSMLGALVGACGANPTANRADTQEPSSELASPLHKAAGGTVMGFTTMVGVEGAFVGKNPIRGIRGDELPWEIASVAGSLTSDGHLKLNVSGVVFADDPSVPPELRGINDEAQFRGLVSCLSDDGKGKIATVNLITGGFPATTSGNSTIDAFVSLPKQCVAPIIFVMAGSEDYWFAVTGVESE